MHVYMLLGKAIYVVLVKWCAVKILDTDTLVRFTRSYFEVSLGKYPVLSQAFELRTRSLTLAKWINVCVSIRCLPQCDCVCARTTRDALKLAGKILERCTLSRKEVHVCCFNYCSFHFFSYETQRCINLVQYVWVVCNFGMSLSHGSLIMVIKH